MLDIDGEFSALVLYTPPELHRREIEISPVSRSSHRVHTAVLERIGGVLEEMIRGGVRGVVRDALLFTDDVIRFGMHFEFASWFRALVVT